MRFLHPFIRRAALLLCVLLAACPGDGGGDGDGGGGPTSPAPRTPTQLNISQSAVTVDEGASVQLSATVVDQHGQAFATPPAGYEVLWSSNATNIASVTGTGLITGAASGQTQVRASAGGLIAVANVTVNAVGGIITGAVTLAFDYRPVYSIGPPEMAERGAHHAGKRWPQWLGGGREAARPMREALEFTNNTLLVTYRPAAVQAPAHTSPEWRRRDVAAAVTGRIRSRAEARLAGVPARVSSVLSVLQTARVTVEPGGSLEAVRERLRDDPAVLRVIREPIIQAAQVAGGRVPNDPGYPAQAWHYMAMDLPAAWRITTGSSAVIVAVVDDGIRFDHPELAPQLTNDGFDFVSAGNAIPVCGGGYVDHSVDNNGWDPDPTIPLYFIPNGDCAQPTPLGGHGTHVAGTVGAVGGNGNGGTGVNWTVRIRPVRVLGALNGNVYDIAVGIAYAAGLAIEYAPGQFIQAAGRAHVINVSIGGPGGGEITCPAVAAATAAGSLVVIAAGNAGTSVPQYPASCPDALSVSSVRPDYDLASYSSWGSGVDIAGPGGEIQWGNDFAVLSTVWDFQNGRGSYQFLQGTSMAAPHVAGVAALVLSHSPGLTPVQLRARLMNYAVDLGPPGPDNRFGAGLVNARNSLTQTHGPQRGVAARLYDAQSGALVQTTAVSSGAFSFARVPPGSYLVMAGEDEGGDGLFGVRGAGLFARRWGGFGPNGRITPVQVQRGAASVAPVTLGLPRELEPNNSAALAGRLVAGGYVHGVRDALDDVDVYAVALPAGTFTFETGGWFGGCGFAFEEDTMLRLYDATGAELAANDDIDANALNFCSRITRTVTAGTYLLGVTGLRGSLPGRYVLQVR
jgi:subtilisin family serine protease